MTISENKYNLESPTAQITLSILGGIVLGILSIFFSAKMKAPSIVKPNNVDKQLIGQWEATINNKKGVLVFTPEKRIISWTEGRREANEVGRYKINAKANPIHLDISELEDKPMLTIMNFISEDEILLQIPNESFKEKRPKIFDDNAFIFQKVSDSNQLPLGLKVTTLEETLVKAKESKAQQRLGVLNRYQQSHFFENKTFISNIQDLNIALNSKLYNFEIIVSNNNQTTAVAIPIERGLKSFIGSVYYKENDKKFASVICSSYESSISQLLSPKMIDNNFQCPGDTIMIK